MKRGCLHIPHLPVYLLVYNGLDGRGPVPHGRASLVRKVAMTRSDHYTAAERWLQDAEDMYRADDVAERGLAVINTAIAIAQAHATLAAGDAPQPV